MRTIWTLLEGGISAGKRKAVAPPALVSLRHTSTLCQELVTNWGIADPNLEHSERAAVSLQQIQDQAFELTGLCAANYRKPVTQCPLLLEFVDRIEKQRERATEALQRSDLHSEPNDALASAILLVGSIVLQAAVCPAAALRESAIPTDPILRNLADPRAASLLAFLDQMVPSAR